MLATAAPQETTTPTTQRRSTAARWLRAGVAVLALWLGWEVWYVLGGPNVHTVVPGKVYRGAQQSPADLDALIQRYGIRTVLSLRGCCQPEDWYMDQARVCQAAGVSQEDVSFSAVHLPGKYELRQLVDVLDHTEYPVFFHCRQGADRTGMAAMIALLLHTDAPYATARRQLGMRYSHLPFGKPAVIDRFFDLYVAWLHDQGQDHTPDRFRRWVLNEYEGGWCNGRIEEVRPINGPARLGTPLGLTVAVRNLSPVPWRFSATSVAGIHLYYKLFAADGTQLVDMRAGLVDRVVPPGERTELSLVVPPIGKPGRYRLVIDLLDENHCWFGQTGMEPWEEEIDVRE